MKYSTLFFDLDDIVYPAGNGIWEAFANRINEYVHLRFKLPMDEIPELRNRLFSTYGTTLRGLQLEYEVNTQEYLDFVHDVPLDQFIDPNPGLLEVLQTYPQRKVIFTNADKNHAKRVLKILGIDQFFDSIIDVVSVAPYCKPHPEAFRIALEIENLQDGSGCVLLDDKAENLDTARQFGFHTILIGNHQNGSHSHEQISNLMQLPAVLKP